jgi:hypothetical protein
MVRSTSLRSLVVAASSWLLLAANVADGQGSSVDGVDYAKIQVAVNPSATEDSASMVITGELFLMGLRSVSPFVFSIYLNVLSRWTAISIPLQSETTLCSWVGPHSAHTRLARRQEIGAEGLAFRRLFCCLPPHKVTLPTHGLVATRARNHRSAAMLLRGCFVLELGRVEVLYTWKRGIGGNCADHLLRKQSLLALQPCLVSLA